MSKKIVFSVIFVLIGLILVISPSLISYIDTSSFYFDVSSFLKDYPYLTYPFGILFLVSGVAYIIICILRGSFNKTVFVIQKANCGDYGDIDLHFSRCCIKKIDEQIYENVVSLTNYTASVIKSEKQKMKNFYKNLPTKKNIAFLSISPMPTLVYAGFCVSNTGRKVIYYHWNRDKSKAYKLRRFGSKINLISEEERVGNSNEYVICVSSSYSIDKDNVDKQFKNCSIKFYKTNLIGTNSIESQKDVNNIANSVRTIIGELPKNCRVHLLLSCSSEVCFAIGRNLNSPALPSTRVYNFGKDKSGVSYWNWNIELN